MSVVHPEDLQNKIDDSEELLSKLIKKGTTEIKPALSMDGIHYPEAEEVGNLTQGQVRSMLQKLAKKGLLGTKFVDRVLTCPNCSSPEIHNKYSCPRCNSYNVDYTQLLEHMKCGYIGAKTEFEKESVLLCPKCKTRLREDDVQYRVIGNCFECEKCNYRFDKPDNVHICQKCGRSFSYQDAKYTKLVAYVIPKKTIDYLGKDQTILENLIEIFQNNGFKTKLDAQITGASGVQHYFDLLAERGQVSIVIDVSVSGSKNDMISLLGKKVDINPTEAIIVDLSKSDELSLLSKVYNIIVFKVTNKYDIPKYVSNFLKNLEPTVTSLALAKVALNHAKPPAKKFYISEKSASLPSEIIRGKNELEEELRLLERMEQVLKENLRLLELKFSIRMQEEEVKAKRKAIEQLDSQVTA
jgi:hypothetical protein